MIRGSFNEGLKWMRTLYFMSSRNKKDLYEILGISRSASQAQIKKAYYQLAQKYHPDKNTSPEAKQRFAEINNAYQTLSDDKKRQFYDQTGSTDGNQFAGFENQDFFNAFRGGFGGQNPREGMGFQSIFQDLFGFEGAEKPRQNQPIFINIDLQFNEAVNGIKKTIEYSRKQTCGTCNGKKSKPGTQPQKCSACQGTGFMTFRQGMMALRTSCNVCHGEGKKITSPCPNCQATGIEAKKAREEIMIPRGIDNGANLKFRGKGHMGGDLNIKIIVRKHPKIQRNGVDAHTESEISIVDAVLGTEVKVTTIYNEQKTIKIKSGVQNGEQIKLAQEGFYRINSNNKGNHIVTVKVKVPKDISEEERKLYEELNEIRKKVQKVV